MVALILGLVLQVVVVGGLFVWGFRKDRRLRTEIPDQYALRRETHGH
jgi:hypothetical protein